MATKKVTKKTTKKSKVPTKKEEYIGAFASLCKVALPRIIDKEGVNQMIIKDYLFAFVCAIETTLTVENIMSHEEAEKFSWEIMEEIHEKLGL